MAQALFKLLPLWHYSLVLWRAESQFPVDFLLSHEVLLIFKVTCYGVLFSLCRSPRWEGTLCGASSLCSSRRTSAPVISLCLWVAMMGFWFLSVSLPPLSFWMWLFLYIFSYRTGVLLVFRAFPEWVALYVVVVALSITGREKLRIFLLHLLLLSSKAFGKQVYVRHKAFILYLIYNQWWLWVVFLGRSFWRFYLFIWQRESKHGEGQRERERENLQ